MIENVLGVLGLFLYVVAVASTAAGVTWVVVKLFPTQEKKKADAPAS